MIVGEGETARTVNETVTGGGGGGVPPVEELPPPPHEEMVRITKMAEIGQSLAVARFRASKHAAIFTIRLYSLTRTEFRVRNDCPGRSPNC